MNPQTLVDILPCAGLVIDSSGEILAANTLASESLGLSVECLTGAPVHRFVPAHVVGAITAPCAAGMPEESTTAAPMERSGICAELARIDGRHFSASVTWRWCASGDESRAIITFVDLEAVDAVEATETARGERRLLHAILQNSPAAIFVKDKAGRYSLMNGNTARVIGRPASELIGHTAHDVFPPHVADVMQANDIEAATLGRRSREERVPTSSGERTFMSHKFPIFDEVGQFEATCSISLDITEATIARAELIASEARLAESEERFRQLTETINECFFLLELPSQRALYVSPNYESIWGRSRDEMLADPSSWRRAVHPDDIDRVDAAAEVHLLAGDYDEEFRIVWPDGTIRWVRDKIYVVRDEEGRPIRLAGVVEDVTERRDLEEQLRHTQKMESIGELAGGVAHDFNNWLTVILGCARMLEGDCTTPDSRSLLDDIRHAGERAASLTRQLLAFSRKEVLEPRVLDLNAVVLDTEKMLVRLLGEDVDVQTALSPSLPSIRVDPGHLVQILMNVAVNARDAMPTGGVLEIGTREVVLDAAFVRRHIGFKPGRYVRLTISDTGKGMSPEIRSRIFEPFFTTKGVGRGTGLGLAVVHGIVTQSGGYIDVASQAGEGTTFSFYFPAIEPEAGVGSSDATSESMHGAETVLLVEDDASVRRVARRVLSSAGYRVFDAADGRNALLTLESLGGAVDLLVTDVVMPNMSGRILADQVRRRTPHVKVLFTSGYTDDAVLRHGVVHAEVSFLQKPYHVEDLLGAARRLLDKEPG